LSDRLIQKIIESELRNKLKKNFYLISEEKKNEKKKYLNFKYIITIDPIDGTENFYAGLPEWGISASIYKDLNHYQSFLFFPSINKLLKTKDKIRKNISKIKSFSSSVQLKKINNQKEFRFFGSCVYSIYCVIIGALQSYSSQKSNSWDILAGANLALEQGLNVRINDRKYNGEFLHPNKKYKIKIQN
jgi:myo-inositol-1(or 4)-monophosphatase